MCYNVKRMCIKSSPMGEGQGGGAGCCELLFFFNPTPSAAQQPRC